MCVLKLTKQWNSNLQAQKEYKRSDKMLIAIANMLYICAHVKTVVVNMLVNRNKNLRDVTLPTSRKSKIWLVDWDIITVVQDVVMTTCHLFSLNSARKEIKNIWQGGRHSGNTNFVVISRMEIILTATGKKYKLCKYWTKIIWKTSNIYWNGWRHIM